MEARRNARVTADLWVAVEGVDNQLRCREGDVSVTGIYFRVDRAVGAVGSVQRLHLAAREGSTVISVLARVVRMVVAEDLVAGRQVVGAGLEFMPDSAVARMALAALVRGVMDARAESERTLEIEHRFAAQMFPGDAQGRDALVHRIGARRMSLDTRWPVEPGAPVRVEIDLGAAGAPVCFEAEAEAVVPQDAHDGERYRIELRIRDGRPGRDAQGLDPLFADLIAPVTPEGAPSRKDHLTGMLARIRLTSLVQLFELERMSGRLGVSRGAERGVVYFRDGRLVDARLAGMDSPRAAVTAMLGWKDGEFEFHLGAVDRPDEIQMSTSGLLLELAQAEDEARDPDPDEDGDGDGDGR